MAKKTLKILKFGTPIIFLFFAIREGYRCFRLFSFEPLIPLFACLGGVVVLIGLLLEKEAEDLKAKPDLKRYPERARIMRESVLHKKAEHGWWVLIFGILLEIVIGGVVAGHEGRLAEKTAHDIAAVQSGNQQVTSMSAVVDLKIEIPVLNRDPDNNVTIVGRQIVNSGAETDHFFGKIDGSPISLVSEEQPNILPNGHRAEIRMKFHPRSSEGAGNFGGLLVKNVAPKQIMLFTSFGAAIPNSILEKLNNQSSTHKFEGPLDTKLIEGEITIIANTTRHDFKISPTNFPIALTNGNPKFWQLLTISNTNEIPLSK